MVFINSGSYTVSINDLTDEILLNLVNKNFQIPIIEYVKNDHNVNYTKKIYLINLLFENYKLICFFDIYIEEYVALPSDIFVQIDISNNVFTSLIDISPSKISYKKIPEDLNLYKIN